MTRNSIQEKLKIKSSSPEYKIRLFHYMNEKIAICGTFWSLARPSLLMINLIKPWTNWNRRLKLSFYFSYSTIINRGEGNNCAHLMSSNPCQVSLYRQLGNKRLSVSTSYTGMPGTTCYNIPVKALAAINFQERLLLMIIEIWRYTEEDYVNLKEMVT